MEWIWGSAAPWLGAKLLVSPPHDLGEILSALHGVPLDGNKTMTVLGQLSNLHDEQRAICYQSGEHYDVTSDGRVVRKYLNLGSYNYLGFADDWDMTCPKDVVGSITSDHIFPLTFLIPHFFHAYTSHEP
jgi:hypothetical protein